MEKRLSNLERDIQELFPFLVQVSGAGSVGTHIKAIGRQAIIIVNNIDQPYFYNIYQVGYAAPRDQRETSHQLETSQLPPYH